METIRINGINTKKWQQYFEMLFYLSLCGNVFFSTYITTYIYVAVAFLFLVIYFFNRFRGRKLNRQLFVLICTISLTYVFLFTAQFIVFRWNTIPGFINHISKFIVGVGFAIFWGQRFRIVLFKCMFLLCLTSIPLWLLNIIVGGIGGFDWSLGKTIWFFCYRNSSDIIRNCGFFWEPGAMGGYICFTFLLFFDQLKLLIRQKSFECFVMIIALATTQSTGAYLSFFTIAVLYMLLSMRSVWRYLLLAIVVSAGLYAYNSVEFLSEKVDAQNESFSSQEWGEYSSNRVGSLYFDLYYVAKHPIVGNGLHERTRLADHPVVAQQLANGDIAASGNGFSDAIAKWGITYLLVFIIVFWKSNSELSSNVKIGILLSLLVLLQGEQYLNYPLFMSIPIIKITGDWPKNPNRGINNDYLHYGKNYRINAENC